MVTHLEAHTDGEVTHRQYGSSDDSCLHRDDPDSMGKRERFQVHLVVRVGRASMTMSAVKWRRGSPLNPGKDTLGYTGVRYRRLVASRVTVELEKDRQCGEARRDLYATGAAMFFTRYARKRFAIPGRSPNATHQMHHHTETPMGNTTASSIVMEIAGSGVHSVLALPPSIGHPGWVDRGSWQQTGTRSNKGRMGKNMGDARRADLRAAADSRRTHRRAAR